jgi:hypothetical protein
MGLITMDTSRVLVFPTAQVVRERRIMAVLGSTNGNAGTFIEAFLPFARAVTSIDFAALAI